MIAVLVLVVIASLLLNCIMFIKLFDYDGNIVIGTTDIGKKMFSLDINRNPEDIEAMKVVRFRVVKEEVPDTAE